MSESAPLPAIEAWRKLLGAERVLSAEAADACYGRCSSGATRRLIGALRPASVAAIPEILRIAVRHRVSLYPISTGRNWGYGTSLPVSREALVLDLSSLNTVREFDAELGTVTVEPGVTQRQLAEMFETRDAPYMVPVTGAGPDCSLLGNALERGYGITPYTDHFGAVLAVEAVLPNGEMYRGALADLGGEQVGRLFKWQIGPYVDGLFTQGGLGVVTAITIALARRPEAIELFVVQVPDDGRLEAVVAATRAILATLPGVCGGINLMNAGRVLAMSEPFPDRGKPGVTALTRQRIDAMARAKNIAPWTMIGALYGARGVVSGARSVLNRIVRRHDLRLQWINESRLAWIRRMGSLASWLPGDPASHVERLEQTFRLLGGRPSTVSFPLAFWKSGIPDPVSPNPARDGSGLIWYSPLVPMRPDEVRRFTAFVDETCARFGFESLITLTSLSERCFDCTLPILFPREDDASRTAAWDCMEALLEAGARQGWVPYRLHIDAMKWAAAASPMAWRLADALRDIVDPAGILAPGRYSLSKQ